ncbi:MAG: carboxypeptidase-like regulatory domain-containing protein [Planctomycetota bacterium]
MSNLNTSKTWPVVATLVVVAVLGLIAWLVTSTPGAQPGPDAGLPDTTATQLNNSANRVVANRVNRSNNTGGTPAPANNTGGGMMTPGNDDNSSSSPGTNEPPPDPTAEPGPLAPGNSAIRVEVTLAGHPAVGATIEVWGKARTLGTTTTAADGTALIRDIAAGAYSVRASATDSGRADRSIKLVDGETAVVKLTLGPPLHITGLVVDHLGQPVSGAIVRIDLSDDTPAPTATPTPSAGRTRFETATEADGSFMLAAPVTATARTVRLSAAAAGHGEATRDSLPDDGFWRAELPELKTGTVRLQNRVGNAPSQGRVVALRVGGDPANPADRLRLDLQPDGSLQWPDTMNPGEWTVLIDSPDGSWQSTISVPRDTAGDLDVELAPSASVYVYVTLGPDGDVYPGARVLAYRTDLPGVDWQGVCDAEGRVVLTAVPPGPLRIQANAPAGNPRRVRDVMHTSQAQTVVINLEG